MSSSEKLLLIDCDPGIDDCLALMMALAQAPNVKIVGITSANGNVGLRDVTINAARIVKLFDMLDQIPIYQGCEHPMVEIPKETTEAMFYHGRDGLGDAPNVEPRRTDDLIKHIQPEHGVNAIIALSKKYAGRLQMVCLGALTNVALAYKLDPELPKRFKSLHIMGGCIRGYGNQTPIAEYNFYVDPESVYTAMMSFTAHVPTQIVTYEVTIDAGAPKSWLMDLMSGNAKRSKFFREVSAHTRSFEDGQIEKGALIGYTLCDTYLMAVVLNPAANKKSKMVRMGVETGGIMSRGALIIDHKNKGSKYLSPVPVELIEEIDVDIYKSLVEHTFNR